MRFVGWFLLDMVRRAAWRRRGLSVSPVDFVGRLRIIGLARSCASASKERKHLGRGFLKGRMYTYMAKDELVVLLSNVVSHD